MTSGKRTGNAFLMLLWILTAAAVLVVTIIYFDRLNKLVDGTDSGSSSRALDKVAASGLSSSSGDEGDDAGGLGPADADTTGDRTADDIASGEDGGEDTPPSGTGGLTPDDLGNSPEVADVDAWDVDLPEEIDPARPIVALTFDDGPGRYTESIIETLKKYNCEATFFLVGYSVERFPDRVKLIYEEGMEIGNHTADHAQLTSGTDEEIMRRVYDNEVLINRVVPVGRLLVRPPYGDHTEHTGELVDRPMVNWSVDSEDWKSKDKDAVLAEIKANVHDGYIILMHEIQDCTAEALEDLLIWLKGEGYQVTTVSKMFAARGTELKRGEVYRFVHAAR